MNLSREQIEEIQASAVGNCLEEVEILLDPVMLEDPDKHKKRYGMVKKAIKKGLRLAVLKTEEACNVQ